MEEVQLFYTADASLMPPGAEGESEFFRYRVTRVVDGLVYGYKFDNREAEAREAFFEQIDERRATSRRP